MYFVSILQSLLNTVNQESLSNSDIAIVANVLNAVLDDNARRAEEKLRQLRADISDLFMKIFDALLDPKNEVLR